MSKNLFRVGDIVMVMKDEYGFEPGTLAVVVGVGDEDDCSVKVVSGLINGSVENISEEKFRILGYYASPENLCKLDMEALTSVEAFMWGVEVKCR